ncbi:MAG: DUF47 domain-containing protein [Candidatus Dormibacteria bacterium]
MAPSLIPRERRFYELFDRQAANIVEAAGVLVAALAEPASLAARHQQLRDLEHQGDDVTHELVRTLNKTFVTPLDREDIYTLAAGLDDVLDFIEEIGDTVALYGISDIPAPATRMAELVQSASVALEQAIISLEGRKGVEEHWVEVHRLENIGDTTSREAIGELFSGAYATLDVIKLKELYTLLEDALDRCEDVANVIESITIKNA